MYAHARLAVLLAISSAVTTMMQAGLPPLEAVLVALLSAAGAVAIGYRLTTPQANLSVQVTIVLVIMTAVLGPVTAGYPPFACVATVLSTAACATEIARRLPGEPGRWPFWPPNRA
jgi:hypothetical protein